MQNKVLMKVLRNKPVISASMEEYMKSDEFLILENCMFNSERINKLENNKYDLETEESLNNATKFLSNLENLA